MHFPAGYKSYSGGTDQMDCITRVIDCNELGLIWLFLWLLSFPRSRRHPKATQAQAVVQVLQLGALKHETSPVR